MAHALQDIASTADLRLEVFSTGHRAHRVGICRAFTWYNISRTIYPSSRFQAYHRFHVHCCVSIRHCWKALL